MKKSTQKYCKEFESRLLTCAKSWIVDMDEINLFGYNLVNVVLNLTSSIWFRVERKVISVKQRAEFIFLGTINSKANELNSPLLNRFGIHEEIHTV